MPLSCLVVVEAEALCCRRRFNESYRIYWVFTRRDGLRPISWASHDSIYFLLRFKRVKVESFSDSSKE